MKKLYALIIVCFFWCNVIIGQITVNQSFDSYALPSGWARSIVGGSYNWVFSGNLTSPTPGAHTGASMAAYNAYNAASGNASMLITPVINNVGVQSTTNTFSFWVYRGTGANLSGTDVIFVLINTAPNQTGAVQLGYIPRKSNVATSGTTSGNSTPGGNSWQQYTFTIPSSYNTSTNYIIFQAQAGSLGYDIYLDDVSYKEYPLVASVSSLSFGNVCTGTSSAVQSFGVSAAASTYGANLTPSSGNITVTPPTGYEVSLTGTGGWSSSSVLVPYSGGALSSTNVYVRLSPSSVGTYNGNITLSGGGASYVIAVTGSAPSPSLSVTPSVNLSTAISTTSLPQNISLSGSCLTNNITVTPPSGFFGVWNGSSYVTSGFTITASGNYGPASIPVVFNAPGSAGTTGPQNISFASTGATTVNTAATGYATNPIAAGTYTYGTGGTYPTLAAAITALNTNGISGAVSLKSNVNGWTETAPAGGYKLGSSILNGYLAGGAQLAIFGYIGGSNTTITAFTPGTGTSDCIFSLNGCDNVTINGINLQENASNVTATTQMEYGYGLFNLNSSVPYDGCQNDLIKNCTITLNKTNTNISAGIGSAHITNAGTAVTPSAIGDLHSSNQFYANTISNCGIPINLVGYAASSPYTLYDQNNDVGGTSFSTGNTFTNWGATVAGFNGYGINLQNQNNANASYNSMNNASGGSNNINSLYGVNCTGTNSTFTVNNNTIILNETSNATSNTIIAINAPSSGCALVASSNTITINQTAGTGAPLTGVNFVGAGLTSQYNTMTIVQAVSGTLSNVYGVYSNGTGVSLVSGNAITLSNNASATTAQNSGIFVASGSSCAIESNTIIATLVTSGLSTGIYNAVASPTLKMNSNIVNFSNSSAASTVYGIRNVATNNIQQMNGNTITISSPSATSGNNYGISNAGGASASLDCNNNNITVTDYASYGIYNVTTNNSPTGNFNNNTITVVGTTGTNYGIYNNGPFTAANFDYNTINVTTTTGQIYGVYDNPVYGFDAVSISNNAVKLTVTAATTNGGFYIYNRPAAAGGTATQSNINYNTFTSGGFNNSTGTYTYGTFPTTGVLGFILNGTTNPTNNIIGNVTSGNIVKGGNGGSFFGIMNLSTGVSNLSTNITNNNLSNINVGSGNACLFYGIYHFESNARLVYINNNILNNITLGTTASAGINADYFAAGSQFNNNTISNVSSAGDFYGIALTSYTSLSTVSAIAGNPVIQNNTITTLSTSGASSNLYGINVFNSASTNYYISGNSISGLSLSGTTAPSAYGIWSNITTASSTVSVYGNAINSFSASGTGSPSLNGIYVSNAAATTVHNIYKNNVNSLSAGTASGTSTQVSGIKVLPALGTYNVYNNFITGFTASSSTNPNSIVGLYATSNGITLNAYFNTIAMGVGGAISGGTNFGASGILFPNFTSSVFTLNNNIVYINATPNGTGIVAALQRNFTGTGGTPPSASFFKPNNNIYFTNSGTANYIYVDKVTGGAAGTQVNGYALSGVSIGTNDASFNACGSSYKAFMAGGRETGSYTENNLSASGLATGTYWPMGASFAYGSGVSIATPAITTDWNGATIMSPPSIGALNFTGTAPSSGAAPSITYSAIPATSYCIASPPVLSATITSGAGINTTVGTKPRLYFKKSTETDVFGGGNTSATNGWKYVEASNSSSPFTFQPNYSLLTGGSAAVGDVIQYFVVAQDNSVSALVGKNQVGFAAGYCAASVNITSGGAPTTGTPALNTYTITAVPSFTASSLPTSFCGIGNPAILSVSPSPSDLAIQWQQNIGAGFSSISGATSNNYSATPPAPITAPGAANNLTYKALLICNGSTVATSSTATASEYYPQVLTTTPAARCGTGTVTLGATGSAGSTLNWYAVPTGGSPIGTGTSFVTPTISTTTNYYVEDVFGNYGNPQTVGAAYSPAFVSSSAGAYNSFGINFTVNNYSTIQSVDIYCNTGGIGTSFSIWVYNSTGTAVVASYSGTTTAAAGSVNTVPVNFSLPPGNYQMVFGSVASGFIINGSSSFPYTTNYNTITLTSSTFYPYYCFFYNWKVVAGCGSSAITGSRSVVTATVNPLPGAGSVVATPGTICAGSSTVLSATGVTPSPSGAVLSSYKWDGPSGYTSGTISSTTVNTVSVTPASSNYYTLTVNYPGTGCSNSAQGYVTVNPVTTPTITTSSSFSACVGGVTTLSMTPTSTGGTWSVTSGTGSVSTVSGSSSLDVTGVHSGTVSVTYTNSCGTPSAPIVFTVSPTPTAVTGPSTVCYSSTATITYTATVDGTGSGSWSSSNSGVAGIGSSTGVLGSSLNPGTTFIRYTIGTCQASQLLTIGTTGPSAIVPSSPTTISLCVGATQSLSDATAGGTWTSSDPTVATVSATGLVTALSGSATPVTITYSTGCSPDATKSIIVSGSSISLTTNGPLCTGNTATLTATFPSATGTYTWSGPNGFSVASTPFTGVSSISTNISGVTLNASGTYSFASTVSGCTSSATAFLSVGQTPTVTTVSASPSTICSGGIAGLSTSSPTPTAYTVYAIPYAPISFTTSGTINSASSWNTSSNYDDGSVSVSLPFSFNFFGTNYTTVNVNANGYVNFGTMITSANSSPLSLPTASAPRGLVSLFWHDMNVGTGNITYGTSGTAPNRKFVISYNAVPDAIGANTGQIVFSEGTNNIDLYILKTGTTSAKTCGIQNIAGTSALTPPGRNNTSYSVAASGEGWRFATPSYVYAWSPSATLNSSTSSSPVSTGLTSSQVFSVTVADQYSSCSGVVGTTTVTVMPNPTVSSVTASASDLCSGGPLTLTAGSVSGGYGSFVSYVWSGPGGYSNTVTSVGTTTVSVAPTVTGAYSVVVNYSGSGCSGVVPAVSSAVNVYAQPAITSITPSLSSLCSGDGFTITSSSTGGLGTATYTWSGAAITTTTGATGISPLFAPTLTGANVYSLALHYDGIGCNDAHTTTTVTTNVVPSAAVSAAMPNICQPTTSASIGLSSIVGAPTSYSVVWNSVALSDGGFSNISGATLSGSSVTINYNPSGGAGSFDGTLTLSNGSCVSSPYPVHTIVHAQPLVNVTAVNTPCVGYAGSIDFTGTDSATVAYSVDGAATNYFTFSGTTRNLSTGAITVPHTYVIIDAHNIVCTTYYSTPITITPTPMAWVGGTSGHETEWNKTTNWTCGFVPTVSDDVQIGASSFDPVIPSSFTASTKNLTISTGGVLNIDAGGKVNVKGAFNNSNDIVGDGKVVLNGTANQNVTGVGTTNNLELDNSNGATINTGSRLIIGNTITITSGTLTTNDSLELASTDTFSTARIAALPSSGAAISGKVKMDQYVMGGYRRYRFVAHPFSDIISLSQLQNYIDITGPGGSTNGFRSTGSNAPSAFRLDPYTSNSSIGYDPGWKPFTKINNSAADSNKVHPGQGIRLFFRGAKGEGLGYGALGGGYTPSSVVFKMMGNVNQGNVSVALQQGSDTAHQSFNMVGNPYPSPVDMGKVIWRAREAGRVTGAAFYIFDPAIGAGGNFVTVGLGAPAASGGSAVSYYVQANTCIQVRAASDGALIDFTEADKSANTSNYLYKAPVDYTTLAVYDEKYHVWDRLQFDFNDKATDKEDRLHDAAKPMGIADFNFYSTSADDRKLAIDSRPFAAEKVIPLGVSSGYQQNFIIRADNIAVPAGGKLVLHDKLLGKYVELNAGTEYPFTIGKDKTTQGDRFELAMKSSTLAVVKPLAVSMTPNPATDDVKISFTSGKKEQVSVRVIDISGVSIYNKDLGEHQNGTISVPLSTFAASIYMVELTQGDQKVTQRLVKE